GIAKLLEPRAGEQNSGDENTAPTSLLGTAGYMSPEQIQGGPVDQRSDIFSFGCVLYEVITGQQPFRGHSVVDTMHRIAYEEFVPAAQINPLVSRDLQRVVRKCLQKDPEARYQSIRDVAIDLREIALEQKRGPIPGAVRPRSTAMRTLSWSVAAVAMMLAVLLTYPILRQSSVKAADRADQPQKESAWPVELSRVTNTGNAGPAAISDDGRYVAHVRSDGDKQSLWIKQVATGSFIQVVSPIRASYTWVALSPDGNYIYFSRADFPEFNIQNLFKVPILGGEVRKLIANVDGCAALSPDGQRVSFARFDAVQRDRVLYVADADGTNERVVIKRRFPDFFTWSVAWSPEGKRLALLMGTESTTPVVKSGDDGPQGRLHMYEVDVESGALRPLFPRGFPGVTSLVWLRDDTGFLVGVGGKQPPQIWFVPYPEGQPGKLTNDLTAYSQITATADSKTVVALRGEMTTNLWIVDRDDPRHPRAITKGANLYGLDGAPRWLPDGNIITPQFDGRANLKVLSPDGQILRSTTEAWDQANPVISADGSRMVYLSNRSGPSEVWVSSLDGSDARQITHAGRVDFVSMLPDGQSVIYNTSGEDQFAWRVGIDGGRPVRITDKPTSRPTVSPDGRWILCRYRDARPGKPLWRTALIAVDHPGPPQFVERPLYGGGPRFEWYPDSRHFAYLDSQGGVPNIWLQNLDGGDPEQLTFFDSGEIYSFSPSPDGRKLVVTRGEANSDVVMIRNFR
ncbi:MAG: protein kinase, partial [Acidobacteriota bacterium]